MIFLVLLSWIHIGSCYSKTKWDGEIANSLRNNLKGKCSIKEAVVKQYDINTPLEDNHSYFVQIRYPSEREQKHFHDLPLSLSRGNDEVPAMMERDNLGPNADWLKNTSPIWLLTNDHPGQNRSYCSVAMQLLGQNHTLSFYRPLHEIDRAHYVIRLKNAYISPYGSAATECGLVMGVEGCETRFGHIQMWHNKCMDMLHKSNMNFNVFFSSNFSYYSKLRVHNASEYETILKDPPSDLKALLDVLETCVERSDQASVDKGSSYLPTYHKKVLMVDACWDFNFYHFVGDGLVRAAHLWEVVRMDTSIMIHINRKELLSNAGDRKKHEESAVKMRKKWLHLLGIDPSRIIHGPVYADEVIYPRAHRCAYPASHPLELRKMGSLFFSRAMNILSMHPALIPPQLQVYFDERWKQYMDWRKGEGEDRLFWIPPPLPTHLPPVLTIQQRSRPSNEGAHQYERYWSNETLTKVYDAAKLAFPEHLVYTMSSLSQVSLAVEVLVYSVTTVLVGAHGAGFTNLIFMPPNSLLLEEIIHIDDRMLSPCGYFGALAGSFGMHHYLYTHVQGLSATKFLQGGRKLYDDVLLHKVKEKDVVEFAVSTRTTWQR